MPLHHLMVGTWTPPGAIFTFAFDDAALSLVLVHRTAIPVQEPISWMTFSHDKRNIYGAALKNWSSYAVESPTVIVHQASFPMLHDARAQSADTDSRAIFLLAARDPPYAVYCNPFYSFAGSGSVFAVDPANGALAQHVQAVDYQPNSGVHGTVFHPAGELLYSADLAANKLWVHRRAGPDDPRLVLVGAVDAPDPGDHPRWVAMHPSGCTLYALMESGNRVCEFAISPDDPLPAFTCRHFPLVPPDAPPGYRGDVVALSHSADYLFASTRGPNPSTPGYVAAFKLCPDGQMERAILLDATPTSGGHSNAVAPSDWTDEWLAVVEDEKGYLDIYRWHNETLTCVARAIVPEPGFGMNATWYD